jgi:pyruvate/2-oxoglutarate dehydrogenase complex dihydrolipoamide acyltransferase (E2) component
LKQVVLDDASWEGVDAGTEALVESWLVQEGARVAAGQPLATVVVVKTNYEVVSPADGVLTTILVPAEATFPRGAALAEIEG